MKFPALALLAAAFLSCRPARAASTSSARQQFIVDGRIVTVLSARSGSELVPVSVRINDGGTEELRIDADGDGTAGIREFSDGRTRVRYSLPEGDRYEKLEIEKRVASGIWQGEYFLAPDRSRYVLLHEELHGYAVLHDGCDEVQGAPGPEIPEQVDVLRIADPGLRTTIERSPLLSPSCLLPPFARDRQAILSAITQVMSSRAATQGQYLGCLRERKLGALATSLDAEYDGMIDASGPGVICVKGASSKPGECSELGDYNQETRLIILKEPQAACVPPSTRRTSLFGDVFFHESLHKAGISNETLVRQIVSCCGSREGRNPGACMAMKASVATESRRNSYLEAFVKDVSGFRQLWATLQRNVDPARLQALFQDILDNMASYPGTAGDSYTQCMKKPGAIDQSCGQAAVELAIGRSREYFRDKCPDFVTDKSKAGLYCSKMAARVEEMIRTNATRSCATDGSTGSFRQSCFIAAFQYARNLFDESTARNGNGKLGGEMLIPPEGLFPSSGLAEKAGQEKELADERTLNGFLSAMNEYFPGTQDLWSKFNIASDTDRRKAMVLDMITSVASLHGGLESALKACEARPRREAACAQGLKDRLVADLHQYFTDRCPGYFTRQENAAQPVCGQVEKTMNDILAGTMSGGNCGRKVPAHPRLAADHLDLSCLAQALDKARSYELDPASIPAKYLVRSQDEQWYSAPDVQRKEAADEVSAQPSRDEEVAGGSGSEPGLAADRPVAWTRFDPEVPAQMAALKTWVGQEGSTTSRLLSRAGDLADRAEQAFIDEARAAVGSGSAEGGGPPATPGTGEAEEPIVSSEGATAPSPARFHNRGPEAQSWAYGSNEPQSPSGFASPAEAGVSAGEPAKSAEASAKISAAAAASSSSGAKGTSAPGSGSSAGAPDSSAPGGGSSAGVPYAGQAPAVAAPPASASGKAAASRSPASESGATADPAPAVPAAGSSGRAGLLSLLEDPRRVREALEKLRKGELDRPLREYRIRVIDPAGEWRGCGPDCRDPFAVFRYCADPGIFTRGACR